MLYKTLEGNFCSIGFWLSTLKGRVLATSLSSLLLIVLVDFLDCSDNCLTAMGTCLTGDYEMT